MQIVLWNLHQQQVNSLDHYLKKNQVKIRFEMSRNHSDLACRRTMPMESDFQADHGNNILFEQYIVLYCAQYIVLLTLTITIYCIVEFYNNNILYC
jgi:hypothetical protein